MLESRKAALAHIQRGGFTRYGKRIVDLPYNTGLVEGMDFGGTERALYLPARTRYIGRLYKEIPDDVWASRAQGILIFSVLYGLLLPEEPIQLYSLHLKDSGLISRIWESGITLTLLEYALKNGFDLVVDCLGESLYRDVFDWDYLSSKIKALHAYGDQNAGPPVLPAIGSFLATTGLVSEQERVMEVLLERGKHQTPYENIYFISRPEDAAQLGLPIEEERVSVVNEDKKVPLRDKPLEIIDLDKRHGVDIRFSYRVLGEWKELPDEVRKKVLRILMQFILDTGNQGARAEKLVKDGVTIYRLRIDRTYRMHLERRNNILIIRAIGAHRLEGIG